ncbi:MAG: TonB-dependent receptor [Sphingomonadaceae bacterium]
MTRLLITLPLALVASPALAQESTAETEKAASPDDIVVVAERLRGQVDTAQSPVATMDEAEIQSMGVGSIGELLGRISPQTGSGRGRGGGGMPVMLLNGQRISNFREIRNIPPEAIRKIEVLPEEVALKFGYSPDTRVVNILLKDKFQSLAVEAGGSLPTLGGFSAWSLESSLTRIAGPSRLSLTASADDTSPLFESERNLVPTTVPGVSSDPDPQKFRTLIADSRNFGLNAAWSKGLGKNGMGGALSLSAAISRADSMSWQGLDTVRLTAPGGDSVLRTLPGPLGRVSHVTTLEGGAGYSTAFGEWQFSATVDATHGVTRTLTDRRADTTALVAAAAAGTLPIRGTLPALAPAGATEAESTSNRVENLVTMIGRPLRLPAGNVSATIKAGYTWVGFDTADQASLAGPVSLKRGRLLGGVNLGIPLTSRREDFLAGAGDITLNLSADVSHLSDFGTLTGWTTGLTWAPTGKLNLQASYIVNEAAPAVSQLGNPQVQTFNVPVYDFTRGETALVTLTSGGNPLLKREIQRDLKLGVTWQLPFLSNSNMVVEYFRNRSSDVTASFPLLTPAIEAAFAGRVTRDLSGRLVAIDQRPVTFYRQEGSRLRWGFNLSDGFGKAEPAGGMMGGMFGGRGGGDRRQAGARPAGGPPPQRAGGGGGRGGGMMGMMGGNGQPGRWSLGVYHTVQFESRVLVAPGGPLLDLLEGDAISGGGTPRHSIEFNGGVFYKGIGSFFNGTWKAPTTLAASGLPGTSDLRFGSTTAINLVLFMDFGQRPKLIEKVGFLKGARMSLRFENLLNSRQKVTDGSGAVPLSYQPDYLDPRGRVITLQFRKMF